MIPRASSRSTRRFTVGGGQSQFLSEVGKCPATILAQRCKDLSIQVVDTFACVHFRHITQDPMVMWLTTRYNRDMFEEAQLYAPVTEDADGVQVHLADNHPGVNDPE